MKFYCLILLLISPIVARPQPNELPARAVTVSYFGETLSHPGLTVGLEHYPLQSRKHQLVWSVSTGAYLHRRNNTSWFLRFQVGQRLIFKGGFSLENFIGLGYLRQYPHGGGVYKVLPNGAIVENKRTGSSKLMPSVALGLGYGGIHWNGKPVKLFARPEIFWKAPFNGYYLTNFAINAGIIRPL